MNENRKGCQPAIRNMKLLACFALQDYKDNDILLLLQHIVHFTTICSSSHNIHFKLQSLCMFTSLLTLVGLRSVIKASDIVAYEIPCQKKLS